MSNVSSRYNDLALLIGAVALLTVFAALQLWLLGALIVFAVYILIQLRRHPALRQPESSPRLRQIAFAAQTISIVGLAYSAAEIWPIAILCIAILAIGHYAAYRFRSKPPFLMRIGTGIALHLAFVWMLYGLASGQPFPHAQVAMLAMAVVSFELFSRLNLFSGMGITILNLYVAATLSRDLAFGVFLVIFVGSVLAFFWQADNEDGVKDNPVILRPVTPADTSKRNHVSLLRTWGPRFALSSIIFLPLVFAPTPHYPAHPLL